MHRNALAGDEVATLDDIPVTSGGRTLVDIADIGPRRTVERAMDEAEYLRLDCAGLRLRPGRRGFGVLATLLREHAPGTTRTRPGLEDAMLALRDRFGLPRPEVNVVLEGNEEDFLWRGLRLIVEVDGRAAHGARTAFERDRVCDADLTAAGYRVVRITGRRLLGEPGAVAAQLRRLLAGA